MARIFFVAGVFTVNVDASKLAGLDGAELDGVGLDDVGLDIVN